MKNQPSSIQDVISKAKLLWSKLPIKPKSIELDDEEDIDVSQKADIIDQNHIWSMSFIFWFAGVIVVYVWYLLFSSLDLVYLIFTGYVLSMAVEKMVWWFTSKTGSRWWGIGLSYFIFVAALLSGVLIMVPFLAWQIGDIGSIVLKSVNNIQTQLQTVWLEQMVWSAKWIPSMIKDNLVASLNNQDTVASLQKFLQQNINQIVSTSSTYLQGAGWIAFNIISAVLNALTQIGFVLTLSVLFSIEKDATMRLIRRFDAKHNSNRHRKISMMYDKLGFWLRSQLILCLFIFSMTGIGLLILALFGIQLPSIFSLAIIAGLTEVVPYVWPLLWSIPALLVGTLNHGLAGFVWVGALFFVIQRMENNVLIPWIMNKTLWVSSLLIFLCMVVGASVLWFIGIMLAVPIAIIISIATEE
jgi:predicted PurR-regulated permease PerM